VLYVTWKEIGLSAAGFDFHAHSALERRWCHVRFEQTVRHVLRQLGTGAPGFNREQGISLPSIAVDRSIVATAPRLVAWNEAVDFYDSIPDTVRRSRERAVHVHDRERRHAGHGGAVHPRRRHPWPFNQQTDALGFSDFTTTASAPPRPTYVFWRTCCRPFTRCASIGPDGQTRLAFSGDRFNSANQGFIVWTCPRPALLPAQAIAPNVSSTRTSYYASAPASIPRRSGQRARDQRDVFVARPERLGLVGAGHADLAPTGWFDNWLPEVAVTGQGAV